MRLILDNISKRDYEWLLSMANALNLKVSTDTSSESTTLDKIDGLLNEDISDTQTTDFIKSYGISETDVAVFRERKTAYQTGKDESIRWDTIKERYGLL